MSHDPRSPTPDPVEELLRRATAEDREQSAGRDAAFLRRLEGRIRAAGERDGGRRAAPLPVRPPRRRLLLPASVAAAAAVLVAFLLLFLPGRGPEPDGIVYREGRVDVAATGAGERITAGEGSGYVYTQAGGAVKLFVGGPSELLVIGREKIRLDQGTVWVHVIGSRQEGFIVETPGGSITVLGTLFSVAVNGGTTVGVARGRVEVHADGAGAVVSAGRTVHFGGDAVAILEGPPAGGPPEWVWRLADRAAGHDWREIYPSGSPHQ